MEEKLKNIFCDTFQINTNDFTVNLSIGDIINWDSLGHLTIITAVEEELIGRIAIMFGARLFRVHD
mgnify:CR=1 FL=1